VPVLQFYALSCLMQYPACPTLLSTILPVLNCPAVSCLSYIFKHYPVCPALSCLPCTVLTVLLELPCTVLSVMQCPALSYIVLPVLHSPEMQGPATIFLVVHCVLYSPACPLQSSLSCLSCTFLYCPACPALSFSVLPVLHIPDFLASQY